MSYSYSVIGLSPSSNINNRFGSVGLAAYRGQTFASSVTAAETFVPSVSMCACCTVVPQSPVVNHSSPATEASEPGSVSGAVGKWSPRVSGDAVVSTVTISSEPAEATNSVPPTRVIPEAPGTIRFCTTTPE
jgi:hypothetical protein